MKSNILYGLMFVGIVTISSISYAQELGLQEIVTGKKDLVKEENDLQFQTYFFEALKQKAINNYNSAIENLENCNQIYPNNLAVDFEFSKNYVALKNYFDATLYIDKALKIEPENVYLLQHKVLIYKYQHNFSEAIKVQKKLIEIDLKYSEDLIALYLQNQEFENAKKLIVEVENNALSTTKIIGYKYYLESREARVNKVNVLEEESVESTNLTDLKKQYEENKSYKTLQNILIFEAENSFFELLFYDSKDGLELFPSQPFLYIMNGKALNELTKYNEAIAVLTIGIDFVIDDNALEADFYDQLSISYKGLNNENEALKYKKKAEQLRSKN